MQNITVTLTKEQYDLIFSALVTGNCAADSAKANADYHGMKHTSALYAEWQAKTKAGVDMFSRATLDARLAARVSW